MIEVLKLLSPILAGFITAIVTVHLSVGRFRREKWWERRVESYANLIDALHYVSHGIDEELNSVGEPPRNPDAQPTEADRRFVNAWQDLRRAIGTGRFLLCDAAVVELTKLERALRHAEISNRHHGHVNLHGMLADQGAAVDACKEALPEIARHDLNLTPRWARFRSFLHNWRYPHVPPSAP